MDNTNISKYKIDYSKWDRIVDSDNDDDNDDVHDRQRPQVTVLDQPTSVTFGGYGSNNSNIHGKNNNVQRISNNSDKIDYGNDEEINHNQGQLTVRDVPTESKVVLSSTKSTDTTTDADANNNMFPSSWIENGTAIFLTSSDSSESRYHYIWSQDRMCVHIRIPLYNDRDDELTKTTKIKYNVAISNMISYPNRHCATFTNDTEKATLLVTARTLGTTRSTDAIVLLNGSLSYPVYSPEDYDENEVDWSIQEYINAKITTGNVSTQGHPKMLSFSKYILISLYKATPMMNMTIWWKKCLTKETEEVHRNKNGGATGSNEAFQKAWDEAHRTFKDSIQSRQKYTL